MKTLLLIALLWGNSPDEAKQLGDQIAIQTECSYVEQNQGAHVYDCGQYMSFSTFKTYISIFVMRYTDVKQVIPWQAMEDNGRAIILRYDGKDYGLIYNDIAKVYAIQYFGED